MTSIKLNLEKSNIHSIKANYLFALSQNLRDALDNMYDARIPALWRKVRPLQEIMVTTREKATTLIVVIQDIPKESM